MPEERCLYCYQPLPDGTIDFHEKCCRKFFGTSTPPSLDFANEHLHELGLEMAYNRLAFPGAQPKIPLTIEKQPVDRKRSQFINAGSSGDYLLKPPSGEYAHLPENEDLTMHLGNLFGIHTADHSLIRLQSGELAYITKRFDRIRGEKCALEDMCQLTETMTSDKYRGSMEKVGRQIIQFSTTPGLDAIRFFEMVLFSFLTGNADMHLKNFSMLTTLENEVILSPAYDLLCTKLAKPNEKDETALTLNTKKSKLQKSDFNSLAVHLKISEKTILHIYKKFSSKLKQALEWTDFSFLPEKAEYKWVMNKNATKLEL